MGSWLPAGSSDGSLERVRMSLYYRHSGRYSPAALIFTLVPAIVAALLLGVVYAYVVLYLPFGGYITLILSLLFGAGVAQVVNRAARWSRIRSEGALRWIALVSIVSGFYVSWGVWVYALLARAGVSGMGLASCLHPAVLWKAVQAINESGAWSMFGVTPSGYFLGALWLIEAVVIITGACLLVEITDPYCEQCQQWCKTGPIARIVPMPAEELKSVLESRRLESLRLSPAEDQEERVELDLSSCSKCNLMHTLGARHLTVKVSDGKREVQSSQLLTFLLLTSDEALALQNLQLLSARGDEHGEAAGVVGGDGVDAQV